MAELPGRSSVSFDSKEKDTQVFASVKEIAVTVPSTSKFRRFSEKFDAWLASRGLEGHGCVLPSLVC